jgi:hypothetical protein
MRIIGVCKTVAQLKAALQNLGETFNGCGRVKVRTAAALNCASYYPCAGRSRPLSPPSFPSRNAVC